MVLLPCDFVVVTTTGGLVVVSTTGCLVVVSTTGWAGVGGGGDVSSLRDLCLCFCLGWIDPLSPPPTSAGGCR